MKRPTGIPAGTLELVARLRPDMAGVWWRRGMRVSTIVEKAISLRDGPAVCGICGGAPDGGEYEFDHIVPIAKGGEHHIDNMQFAHASCNRAKGAA